ncbi:MAG: hypothetical protein BWY20_02163 [Spirochaetes bacterium ADurb.Bin215]|nr:MAG: hypothetical protein BWY20_02163 [Spirochaetes bacterium ADurb.Bin215]
MEGRFTVAILLVRVGIGGEKLHEYFGAGRLRHNEMQGGVSRGVFLIGIGICGKKGAGAFDMTIAYRFMEGG